MHQVAVHQAARTIMWSLGQGDPQPCGGKMRSMCAVVCGTHCLAFAADPWVDGWGLSLLAACCCFLRADCRCSSRTPLQGGGTFDISILEISGGVFEVRCSADTGSWRRHTALWHA